MPCDPCLRGAAAAARVRVCSACACLSVHYYLLLRLCGLWGRSTHVGTPVCDYCILIRLHKPLT